MHKTLVSLAASTLALWMAAPAAAACDVPYQSLIKTWLAEKTGNG